MPLATKQIGSKHVLPLFAFSLCTLRTGDNELSQAPKTTTNALVVLRPEAVSIQMGRTAWGTQWSPEH